MEKIKNLLSPGKAADDEVLYGSGTSSSNHPGSQNLTGDRVAGQEGSQSLQQGSHSGAGPLSGTTGSTLDNPSNDQYGQSRSGLNEPHSASQPLQQGGQEQSRMRDVLSPGTSNTDASRAGAGSSSTFPTSGQSQSGIAGQEQPYGSTTSSNPLSNTTGATSSGYGSPQQTTGQGQQYGNTPGATSSALGSGTGPRAAETGSLGQQSNQSDMPGSFPATPGQERDNHLGRDAAAVGGGGAAALAARKAFDGHNQQQPRVGESEANPYSSNLDPRVDPGSRNNAPTSAGALGSGNQTTAGSGPYGNTPTTGSSFTPGSQPTSGLGSHGNAPGSSGAFGSQGQSPLDRNTPTSTGASGSGDHHYGRDAGLTAGGAGAAGLVAREAEKHHDRQNPTQTDLSQTTASHGQNVNEPQSRDHAGSGSGARQDTERSKEKDLGLGHKGESAAAQGTHTWEEVAKEPKSVEHDYAAGSHGASKGHSEHDNKDTERRSESSDKDHSHHHKDHHHGRDAGAAAGGAGLAAHEAEKHHGHHHDNRDANEPHSKEHHHGRDAAAGAGAAGVAAHEANKHHGHHDSQAPNQSFQSGTSTSAGPFGSRDQPTSSNQQGTFGQNVNDPQLRDHHYGRDAALAGGAGAAGLGAYEADKHHHHGQQESQLPIRSGQAPQTSTSSTSGGPFSSGNPSSSTGPFSSGSHNTSAAPQGSFGEKIADTQGNTHHHGRDAALAGGALGGGALAGRALGSDRDHSSTAGNNSLRPDLASAGSNASIKSNVIGRVPTGSSLTQNPAQSGDLPPVPATGGRFMNDENLGGGSTNQSGDRSFPLAGGATSAQPAFAETAAPAHQQTALSRGPHQTSAGNRLDPNNTQTSDYESAQSSSNHLEKTHHGMVDRHHSPRSSGADYEFPESGYALSSEPHHGRDAALAGGAGAAGLGAYEAHKHHGHHGDSTSTGQSSGTGAGAPGMTGTAPGQAIGQPTEGSHQHHHGRDAAAAGGLGAGALGTTEAVKHHHDERSLTSGNQSTNFSRPTHNQTSAGTAAETGAAGAGGLGAYEAVKHHESGSHTDPYSSQRAAPTHESTLGSSTGQTGDQGHHYGRDAALAGGGAVAGAGGAHEYSKHHDDKLEREREKTAEHKHKEAEKAERKHEHHEDKEKKPSLISRILHPSKSKEQSAEHDSRHSGDHSRSTHDAHRDEAGFAGAGAAGVGVAAHEHGHDRNRLHKDPPAGYTGHGEPGSNIVTEPHTGLPVDLSKGSGQGGTDGSSNISGLHSGAEGTNTDWQDIKKANTPY